MKKKEKSLDDLRAEYKDVFGKDAPVRCNRATLQKRITDERILQHGRAQLEQSEKQGGDVADVNLDFEKLAEVITDEQPPEQADVSAEPPKETRGGPREGAGRPTGQTDSRARIERVMALDVPDLGAAMVVDAINVGLAKTTGVGLDEKPVSSIDLDSIPHGSASMALGLTKLLYYWFPSMQGRTDAVTLHLESLFLIINPFRERAIRKYQMDLENQNGKKESDGPQEAESKPDKGDTTDEGKTKPVARPGSKTQ